MPGCPRIILDRFVFQNERGSEDSKLPDNMDPIQECIDVKMIRENLDDIPEYDLPAGYSIRWYQPGYKEYWQAVQSLADVYNRVTPELFERQFGTDAKLLSERQCFLCVDEKNIIGTATAWLDNLGGKSLGRIHWLAIVPQQQGKGLAKPLLTTICKRLKELGHSKTYLTTQTVRIHAINLYTKFGFAPMVDSERDREIWEKLRKHIKYPVSF
jgi:N-acetylglutamate synthase-like GNAT family acetyltransferase